MTPKVFGLLRRPRHPTPTKLFILYHTMVPTADRLAKLRELMAARGLAAYFIPSEDAHQV